MKIQRLLPILLITLILATQIPLSLHAQSILANKIAIVRAQGVALLSSSGQPTGTQIAAGALLIVKGRNADNSLLFVITEEGQAGWVATNSLLVINSTSLPIVGAADESQAIEKTSIDNTEAISATLPSAPDAAGSETSQNETNPSKPNQSETNIPTSTPTSISIPKLPDGAVSALVTAQVQRLNLRNGPGVEYAIVGKADAGSTWIASGRNEQADWVQIIAIGADEHFWASAAYLELSAPISQLPVPANLPSPLPTATATATTPISVTPPSAVTASPSTANGATSTAAGKTGLSGTLVFQDRIGGTIYVYNLATDSLRPLTGGIDPAISPDGKRVALTRDGDQGGLFVINLDGSDEQRLYDDRELLRSPKWSPDGNKIVFTRSNGYSDCRILQGKVCMPDEALLDLLPEELRGDAVLGNAIKALPNSRQYFFTLARIQLDNREYRDIAAKGMAEAPDWSDGGIVYNSDNGLQHTDDRADSDSQRIAQDIQVGNYIDPDQQPNGGRIVFQHSRGGHWQIFTINPDGSGMSALTSLATVMVDALPSSVSPAWSPDGQQIVYLSNRNSYESAGPWHLWVMNGDGSNQRRLPIEVEFTYSFGAEQMVSWGAG